MPLYDYRCPQGHFFEQMAPIAARERQVCPACEQTGEKIPSRVSLGGQASPGPSMEQMPQTWRGTFEGNPEYVGQLRRQWEARQKLEAKYEELRGDRRPVLAHEGRYQGVPLRAGDPVPGAHGHTHGHGHHHGSQRAEPSPGGPSQAVPGIESPHAHKELPTTL